MLAAEKLIIDSYFLNAQPNKWGHNYYDVGAILTSVKNINAATTGKDNDTCTNEFFKEILQYFKKKMIYSPKFLAEIFVMAQGPKIDQVEYIFENVVCTSSYGLTPNIYEKAEWKSHPFKVDHVITYLTHKNTQDRYGITREKLVGILKNLKERLDLDRICTKIQKTGSSSRILDILFIAGEFALNVMGKESDEQKIYANLVKTYYGTDNKILQEALKQNNFDGISYMFKHFGAKPTIEDFNTLISASRYDSATITWLIDILVCEGLTLTYVDVLNATRYKIFINNVERFLTADDKKQLAKKCFELHFFKYKDIMGISDQDAKMYEYVTSRHSAMFGVKLLLKQGYKPDRLALKYACENPKQKKAVILLMEHVKPDAEIFNTYCNACDKTGILAKMNNLVNKRLSYQKSGDESD